METNKRTRLKITKKTFLAYIRDKLTPARKKVFENEYKNDDFVRDAVTGFTSVKGSACDIREIDRQIAKKLKISNTLAPKLIYYSVLFVSVAAFVWFFNQENQSPDEKISRSNNVPDKQFTINKTEESEPIEENKRITSVLASGEQKMVDKFERNADAGFIEKIKSTHIKNIKTDTFSTGSIGKHYMVLPVTYIYNLKVVDYSKIRRKTKENNFDGGSLPPKYENRQSRETLGGLPEKKEVYYTEFITKAMRKFAANSYKEALADFDIVLEHYPDDLNALFYGGLCCYNHNLNNRAVEYFDMIIGSNYTIFLQESAWYKALALINSGETEKAEEILHEIAASEGFYSQRAGDSLKTMKEKKR